LADLLITLGDAAGGRNAFALETVAVFFGTLLVDSVRFAEQLLSAKNATHKKNTYTGAKEYFRDIDI